MTESPLGSPISNRELGLDGGKLPLPDKSGDLQGREVSPLSSSSDSFAGSDSSETAVKIEQTSKRELEKTPPTASKKESHQFERQSPDDWDTMLQEIDSVATDLLKQGQETKVNKIHELYAKAVEIIFTKGGDKEALQQVDDECQKLGINFIDLHDKDGRTLLDLTLDKIMEKEGKEADRFCELAIILIDSGADTSRLDEDHWEALLTYSLAHHSLEDLGDFDFKFPTGLLQETLEPYLEKGDFSAVHKLVRLGLDVNSTYKGQSLLHHAAKAVEFDLIVEILPRTKITLTPDACKELLEKLALLGKFDDAESLKKLQLPPALLNQLLVQYLREENATTAKIYLQLGADLRKIPKADQEKLIEEIIDSSLNVASLRKMGLCFDQTLIDKAFFVYTQTGNSYQTQRALLLGANVDIKDAQGNTALHRAAQRKDVAQVLTLMRFGANPLAQNSALQTPLAIAKEMKEFQALQVRLQPRFEALKSDLLLASKGLTATELRQLAYTLEVIMPMITATATAAIDKVPKVKHGLVHSLLYRLDPGEKKLRDVYLLLQKTGDIKGQGTSKKATEALKLPLKLNAEHAERAAFVISKQSLTEKEIAAIAKEAKLYLELKALPGIWPLHVVLDYFHQAKKGQVRRIALLMPPAITFHRSTFTFEQLVSTSLQIAQGLAGMHAKGYVHGDFKGENALADGVRAGVTDFGFTHQVGTKPSFDVIAHGYYGSIFCTAPELYGNKNFSGDRQKLDVFAYGDMLYRKHFSPEKAFHEQTPWSQLLSKYRETYQTSTVTDADKAEFQKLLADKVVAPYNALKTKTPLTPKEQLELIIYKALLPDPKERPTMQQLVQALSLIKTA